MWVGSELQAAGPATANEPSAKCVLVRRTVKSPRRPTDDRIRWSLRRLHKSVKYPGSVPWKTSNIKTHSSYFMRLEIGSQCIGGAAVVQRDYELVPSTVLKCLLTHNRRHCEPFPVQKYTRLQDFAYTVSNISRG